MIRLINNHQVAYQKWVCTILTWNIISKPTLYMSHCYLFMQMAFFWIAFRVVRIWGVLQMTFNKRIPISRGQVINLFIGEHPENIMDNFHRIPPMTTKDILNPIWKNGIFHWAVQYIQVRPVPPCQCPWCLLFFFGFYDICSHCGFQGRPKKLHTQSHKSRLSGMMKLSHLWFPHYPLLILHNKPIDSLILS